MTLGGDPWRIRDHRSGGRSQSPPHADGDAGSIPQQVRGSAREVAGGQARPGSKREVSGRRDHRSRGRSHSPPPPADGGAGSMPRPVRGSALEVAGGRVRQLRYSVSPRREDEQIQSRPAFGTAGAISRPVAGRRGYSSSPRREDEEVSSRPAHGGVRAISRPLIRSTREELGYPESPQGYDEYMQPQLGSLRVAALMDNQPPAKTVHPQLRLLLSYALAQLRRANSMDDQILDQFLQQVSNALQQAGFRLDMILELQSNMKKAVNRAGSVTERTIHKAFNMELCRLIDSERKPGFIPKKGKPCIILVTGLRGSGKTAASVKFAYHLQSKGHRPSLVCADTRRVKAFDAMKHIAREAKIPCYGSCTELDSVKIAVQGVEKFRREKSDVIIIDTTGALMSEDAFFSEIQSVDNATKPDMVILVVDAGDARSAFEQAENFKRVFSTGSVIVTKMDDHSTGGGVLNALAAAKLPVILLGTGKGFRDFEMFDVKLFSKTLVEHKVRSILIETEDLHQIYDDMKLSEAERKSAIDDAQKECEKAYNDVLERHKFIAHQICSSELKCKRLCDVLGEKVITNADIQSVTTLKERYSAVLTSLKSLESEKNSRTEKLQSLLSKGLALLDFLGVTNNEQKKYKCMLENLSSSVQEANGLSNNSLEKLETRIRELELKKAENADQSKHYIIRKAQIYFRGEAEDRGGLKDLIKLAVEWEAKNKEVILYGKEALLGQLNKKEQEGSMVRSYNSRQGEASNSDTDMGQSASSRSDTDMGHTTSSSGTSNSSDPDYIPSSSESDIEMSRIVVPEPSDSI